MTDPRGEPLDRPLPLACQPPLFAAASRTYQLAGNAGIAYFRDVVKHKKVFYNASYANYDACLAGQLRLIPEDAALAALRDDFQRMIGAGMFIGEAPAFDAIIDRLRALETTINQ